MATLPFGLRTIFVAGTLLALAFVAVKTSAQQTAPDPSKPDTLLFRDGDRLTGKLLRVENGDAVFRTNKAGELTIDFDHVGELICNQRFAVLRKGVSVSAKNAIIGTLDLLHDSFIVTTDDGKTLVIKTDDVSYAIDDETFEREVRRITPFHEGWSITASAGGSLVRSTENSTAINTDVSFKRTIPGVRFLPERNTTSFAVSDNYKVISGPSSGGQSSQEESHIFEASAERTETIVHTRFYVLANYKFNRNYAQGLLAQHVYGGGLGWTVFKTNSHRLDIKTDLHRETQDFNENEQDDVIAGQTIAFEYEEELPGNLSLEQKADYLPSYSDPHKYSANTTVKLRIPLFWHVGLTLGIEDNYLNNAEPALKRNTFTFAPALSFSK